MITIRSTADFAGWRDAYLNPERDRAPKALRLRDIALGRYLSRRDARRYGWPAVDAEDEVVSIAWGHARRRHDERLARLTEVMESEVAPLRSFRGRLVAEAEVEARSIERATAAVAQLAAPELGARTAGESQSEETIVRRRRLKEHRAVAASLSATLSAAQQRRHELDVAIAEVQELLVERWDLHVRNATSWWSYLSRIGEVIARGAARRHPDPTTASTLLRRLIAEADPHLPTTHPWSHSTTKESA